MADTPALEPHKTKRIEVWDSKGIRRNVRPVDAKEILEAGGTKKAPKQEKHAELHT